MDNRFLGIPYPVTRHSQGLFRSQGGIDQIKSDLLFLIQSNLGQRVMLLDYGADLSKFLFEPNDSVLVEQVKQSISVAINTWEPRIVVSDISVSIPSLEDVDNQTGQDLEHILLIQIDIFDPERIQEVQQLTLEIPLP